MAFHSPYSIIEGLWKRKEKDELLETHMNKNEKQLYKSLNKFINLLIVINIPLIFLAIQFKYFIWGPPFFVMILCTIRQTYRRMKLEKYGFYNYKTWYRFLYAIFKWFLVVAFFIYGSHQTIIFALLLL